MIFKVSTTGSVSSIPLPDLGLRTLEHPTVELDLGLEYSDDELLSSTDLENAITNGWLSVVEKSGGSITEEEALAIALSTVSGAVGGEVATFKGLADTPDEYPGYSYFYAVSSASGVAWKSDFLENEIHVSPEYVGDSNGSSTSPFRTINEAAFFARATYSGTNENVVIVLHPGVYEVSNQVEITLPEIKAVIGTDSKSVVIKPTSDLLGQDFILINHPVEIHNVTVDSTDIPTFATTSGTGGVKVLATEQDDCVFYNSTIKGFWRGVCGWNGGRIWAKDLSIIDSTIAVCVANGTLFDADLLYIDGCRWRHINAMNGAEVYVGESEMSSAYVDGLVGSGIAVYADGEDTYVELFAGTNIWSCNQNIIVTNGAELRVDNCVLESTNTTPGIEQRNGSFLTIVNSRAPLGSDQILIEDPENVYINSFDSSEGLVVIGTGSDKDQDLLMVLNGEHDRPKLSYRYNYGDGKKALVFESSKDGFAAAVVAKSKNADAGVGVHTDGSDGYDYESNLGLASFENGIPKGWKIIKRAGSSPELHVVTTASGADSAIVIDYDNYVRLESGVSVNKILDEDNFVSDDPNALVTQQSTKAFVENYTYGKTDSDDRYLLQDGSKSLTDDWDAGDYIITSSGFVSGNSRVDYANFCNITGILTGGALSVNAVDDTLLDVEAGTALYVDMSDRDNPIVEKISWPAQTWDPELAGGITKWIGVERTSPGVGTLVAQHKFSQAQRRTITLLGRIWNFDEGDDIKGVGQYKYGAFNSGKTIQDLTYALGSINISGNYFTATASGVLRLNRSAGEAFRAGANYSSDNTSPNIYESITVSGIDNYSYHIQGDAAENKSYLEPNYYDLNGTKTAVPTDKWTIQRVYYYPVSNVVLVTYGQYLYDDYDEAAQNLTSESLVLNSETLEGAILRAFLVLKEGCTDLTDSSQAAIVEASQFGSGGGGTGATTHSSLLELNADDHLQYIRVDGARGFTSTVSGVTPVLDNDLATKSYVDDEIDNLTTDHGELTGLSDDDHTQYLLANGTRELSADWDAGDFIINSAGFKKDNVRIDYSIFSCVTGLLTGGTLSINAVDDTLLDVEAGTALYVDMTDRTAPVIEVISWPAQTYDPELNGGVTKWVGVQRTAPGVGTLTASHKFTQAERRVITVLGRIWNFDLGDDIKGVGNYKAGTFNTGKTVQDLAYALGAFNISGNSFFATASGSLLLSRSSGEAFRFSANYTADNTSPNIYLSPPASGIDNYSYHIQGDSAENLSEINPDYYDLDGTKTAVPSGKWTIQRVYYYPVSNVVLVTYGQYLYDDKDEALANLSTEDLQLNSETLEGAILRAFLVLQEGCTDLTNDTQAGIVESLQFGASGGSGGGSGVEDHGLLTGLGDDDHPQYHNDARGDARYYTQEQVDTISGSLYNLIAIQTVLATVQVERDTDFTVGTTWTDVTFETTAYENQPDIIEHDNVNTERILIKADGTYSINYGAVVQANTTTTSTYSRILKNGTDQIPASDSEIRTYQNERHELASQVTRDLLAGDYIAFQLQRSSEGTVTVVSCDMNVIKLDGVKGDKGDQGDQGPPGVITVSGTSYFDAYDSAGTLTLTGSWQDVPFNVVRKNSGDFTFTSDTELTIPSSMTYFIIARVTADITSGTNRSESLIRLVKDTGSGYVEIPGSRGALYHRLLGEGSNTATVNVLDDFSAGDKIKVQIIQDSGADTISLLANGSALSVYIPAGATGPQGLPGVDGIDAGGTMAVIQVRRTTQYTNIPLSWVDLTFDTTDIEYDDTVLEHDDVNRDRILIKRTGYYWIGCHFTVDDEARCRIRVNDTTVIPGSDRQSGDIADTNQIITMMANPVIAQLTAGDFITVQIQATTSDEYTFEGATLIVFELLGAKGDKGDPGTPGSGSTVNIYDEGSPVANTPHSLLNFTGAGVSVSDVDGDQVNIDIPGATTPIFGSQFSSAADESETNTNSSTPVTKLTLSVTGIPAGTYRIGWYYEWRRNSASNDYSAQIVIDSTTTIMDHAQEAQDVNSWHTESGFYIGSLSAGNHSIVLSHFGESTGNTSYTRRARLEIWRVS